jgi:aspartyl aminopeptidase
LLFVVAQALLKSTEDAEAVRKEERGWMVAFFDNEEIGSATAQVKDRTGDNFRYVDITTHPI